MLGPSIKSQEERPIAELMKPRIGWGGLDALTLGNVKVLDCAKIISISKETDGALEIVSAHSLVHSTNGKKMESL